MRCGWRWTRRLKAIYGLFWTAPESNSYGHSLDLSLAWLLSSPRAILLPARSGPPCRRAGRACTAPAPRPAGPARRPGLGQPAASRLALFPFHGVGRFV